MTFAQNKVGGCVFSATFSASFFFFLIRCHIEDFGPVAHLHIFITTTQGRNILIIHGLFKNK